MNAAVKKEGGEIEFRTSTFRCAYCNTGAERFLDVFHEGKCVSCGGPAGVVVEVSRPEDIEIIRRAVMLVYCESEAELAREIMAQLAGAGIEVIDPQVVSENEKAGNRLNTLSFLVQTTKFTLVIPSSGISTDRMVATVIEAGMMSGRQNIAPIYPSRDYVGRQMFLDTIWGVAFTDGPGTPGMEFVRFIEYVKKEAPQS